MKTPTEVPASTAIRTKSVDNVDETRLAARLEWLREWFRRPDDLDGRADLRDRVRESINIERALARRYYPYRKVTDGRHLEHDVYSIPKLTPCSMREWRERNGLKPWPKRIETK